MTAATEQYIHLEKLDFSNCSWEELDAHEKYFRENLIPFRDAIPDSIAFHGKDGVFTKSMESTLVRGLLCLHRVYAAKAIKSYAELYRSIE